MIDWKDQLGAAFGIDTNKPADENTAPQPEKPDAQRQQGKQKLSVFVEKKGRHGKTATIITGFIVDDDALKKIAADLKKQLGTGGSARAGEILLQGEYRDKAAAILKRMNFNI